MNTEADHLSVKPVPDGKVVLKTMDGEEHSHLFGDPRGNWEQQAYGIVFKTATSRTVFPWTNIVWYEVFLNSTEYDRAMIQWLKDCDHDWLTHPQVGHYCRICRLDMKDLEDLLTDQFEETPALVIEDKFVDREAAKHEGSPDNLSGKLPPPRLPRVRVMSMSQDPMKFCDCTTEEVKEHEGPCRLRPDTWPVEEIDLNDDDDGLGGF